MDLRRRLFALALGRRLPRYDGELRLAGLSAPVTIRRDRYAIPCIEATNDEDAWFGLGFCQGQDRAVQLELRLRTLRGTLSALFGRRTLEVDRLARRIGFREAAERQVDVLDADIRANAAAFARGVNAGVASGRRAHELVLLRAQATTWDAADVLGVAKLFSFLLIGNWDVELARLKILQTDGPEALADLDPGYPADHPVSAPPGATAGGVIDRLAADRAAFAAFAGAGGGSNNWAIAGSRTASGRPIVANDPHLEAMLPPQWYLAHVRTPAWAVTGAALVGGPAVGAGHNGFAAWGITAALVDTTDLFSEEVSDDGRLRQGDAFVECERRREVIEVRGAAPVVEEVLITPRGPIIGPALAGEVGALSLRATWLDPKPARGFAAVAGARSFEEFRRQFKAWPLLNQNVVYADSGGTIAWQMVGDAPRRRRGWGTLPQPGWAADAGWEEDGVAFEALPHAVDPESGFVATANNKPLPEEEGPYLGVDWLDGYRLERIVEALAARSDWDVAAALALQMDETSLAWREVRRTVLGLRPQAAEACLALDLLAGWDGVVSSSSSSAAVFELFVAEMWRRATEARAPRAAQWALGRGFTPLLPLTTFTGGRNSRILRLMRAQPPGWFGRPWPAEMIDALGAAVRRLRAESGEAPAGWAWGRIRPLRLEHPMGRLPQLAWLLNRGPFAWGGDSDTVSAAGTTPLRPLANPTVVASLRMVVEVGSWDESRFALPGGQSGNPLSPHYDDLLPFWREGKGVPIAWSAAAVAKAARSELRLLPRS